MAHPASAIIAAMNRLVASSIDQIRPESLPPARDRGDRAAPGNAAPARLLFITAFALGFKTLSGQLEAFTASRDDVDAVHLKLRLDGSLRWLGAGLHRLSGWDLVGSRTQVAWKVLLDRLFRGPVDPARFDAVLVSTQGLGLAMPGIRARYGLPYGVYIDTTTSLFCRELGGHAIPETIANIGERHVYRGADFVAGMSRWSLNSVRDDYGIDPARLVVVHNAVPIPPAAPTPAPRTPGQKPRIVIVGNDWVRKGGPRLLAWHQARWTDRAELHVISSTAPVDRSAKGVIWHGSVPYATLQRELLPSMDIFALPTRRDMSPWAAIEAAGLGLPVVSSRIGALGEIVLDGRTGLLCRPDADSEYIAAIERLIADPPLRASMSAAARQHMLDEFSPGDNYGRLIDRMKAVAGPSTTRPAASPQ